MTYVSTPGPSALPRQRTGRRGSLGAIAVVIAIGAAVGFGITVTGDEVATGNPSANTFTAQREAQTRPAEVNPADRGYLGLGAELSAEEALKNAVKQGQVPERALTSSAGAGQTAQFR